MSTYSWLEWLFFFFFYSFFGWCFESTYVSLKKRHFVNRGFIRGPLLPLYGSGAIMMLVVSIPFQNSLILTYLAGCIAATALEYVTGVVMEALFKVRYWDYSNQPFNFQGQICLSSTLAWGGLTILMTHVIHKPIERFAFWLPEWALTLITMLVGVCFVADFALSFKAALDLKDVLVRMEKAREDLERMQKRLDVIIALADEAVENRRDQYTQRRDQHAQRRDEVLENMEARFESILERLPYSEQLREKREELLELRARFHAQREKNERTVFLSDVFKRGMIKGNPTMVSRKFAAALEELQQAAETYRKKKENEE